METSLVLSVILGVLFLSSLSLLVLQERAHRKQTALLIEQNGKSLQSLVELNSKSQALVAAKDPLAYQAIQVMGSAHGYSGFENFDPSDEAEVQRIAERHGEKEDEPDAFERSFIDELGVDGEFL